MKKYSFKPELLAPAGDLESFKAAINSGADAVYLGLDGFNARIKAENFNSGNIKNVIDTAHLYGVKVYITVNILIKDEEVPTFIELVKTALSAGADAFIIQDLGMAVLLKKLFPDIVLHASTQMGIHNAEGALALKKLGFTRVVLSRETKLEDIADIKNKTGLEIEYFVQGALCVAFSGNCYMSSLKNGNSGNRGLCRQLCRLKYKSKNKSGYLLSPNDLCLMKSLDTLFKAGVTSFKIEGRLKRPAYVASAVTAYRYAIDNEITDKEAVELEIKLAKVFTRGNYNKTAYLYDNDNIIDIKNQAHYGEYLGTVLKKTPFKDLYRIYIKSNSPINRGDGLKLVGKTETSLGVGNVETDKDGVYILYTTNQNISVNDKVFRALNFEFEKELLSTKKRLPVLVNFIANSGTGAEIQLKYNDITVIATSEKILERAVSRPLEKNDVLSQLKFNDTPFYLDSLNVETDGVFMTKSELNSLRRTAVTMLIDRIVENNTPVYTIKNSLLPTINNIKQRDTSYVVLNEDCKNFNLLNDATVIYSPLIFTKDNVKKFLTELINSGYKKIVYINLPIIATGKEVVILDEILNSSKTLCDIGVVVNNYYGFKYLSCYKAIAGTGLNVFNAYTYDALLKIGFIDCIESIELRDNTFNGLTYSGNPALMTLCHCPFKVAVASDCFSCKANSPLIYVDEKNNPYKIRRYKILNCYFEVLFNGKDLSLTEKANADVTDLRV